MEKLAIQGGTPVRITPFPDYVTIGEEEKRAVMEVLDSTVLSKFLGTWSPDFYGGPRVQAFEREWADYFGVKHAVSVNSATSGLHAAMGGRVRRRAWRRGHCVALHHVGVGDSGARVRGHSRLRGH